KTPSSSAPASYPYAFDRVERTVYFGGLTNNGDRENFFGAIVTTWPVAESLTVANLDPSATTAQLHLVMQGGIDINHIVSATLNDHELGPVRFGGMAHSINDLAVPANWLMPGENTLLFTALNG